MRLANVIIELCIQSCKYNNCLLDDQLNWIDNYRSEPTEKNEVVISDSTNIFDATK